ncbi:uncharacterized protein LOC141655650 [Silene latifolia]|uniref:uncharacterized protein LOC141655650 n=1 Tax=Silene latifolia TaxID=37657 RepID=UPI003D78213E
MNTRAIDGAYDFNLWRINNQLVDIPFKGPRFTWCNNRKGVKRVYERIDHAFGSREWFTLFPNTGIKHYPIQISDHAPIEVDLHVTQNTCKKPYKLDAWVLTHEDCIALIKNVWRYHVWGNPSFRVARKLSRVRHYVKKWALDKRLVWKQKWEDFDIELERGMDMAVTEGNDDYYTKTNEEVREFSRATAVFLRQRAKLKWMVEGDTLVTDEGVRRENMENLLSNFSKTIAADDVDSLNGQFTAKKDVTKAVLSVLNSGMVLKELNRTFIALIPKCDSPEGVGDYRPISLCNVFMRIISKCITNRLGKVMGYLVGEFQNAFVPGRHILDNVLLAHEALHKINTHKKGKYGRFAFKADMSKAYDRVRWDFLQAVLERLGFPE